MNEMANHQAAIGCAAIGHAGRFRLKVGMIVIVVSCLLAGLGWIWHVTRPIHLAEVSRADLELREARLFLKSQDQPFSGVMVEFYPQGRLQSRSQVSDGLLHGVSEGWYTNGLLQVRESFNKGVSHGPRTKWYANGSRMSEAIISEGKVTGTFRRWHENGTLAEQIEMRNGIPEGLSQAFYPSGCLKTQVRLVGGKPVEQKHWADGEVNTPIAEVAH